MILFIPPPLARLHVRVNGEGFIRFRRLNQPVYAAEADLVISCGRIESSDGLPLMPTVLAKPGTLSIAADGTITVDGKNLGQLMLIGLPAPSLRKVDGYFQVAANIKPTDVGTPGQRLLGVIQTSGDGAAASRSSATPSDGSGKVTVEIRMKSELAKPEYTFADIATITGDSELAARIGPIAIETAGTFAGQKIPKVNYLYAKLNQAHIKPDRVSILEPEGASVQRKGQVVSGQQLVDAAINAVVAARGNTTGLAPTYRAELTPNDMIVPPGDVRLSGKPTPIGMGWRVQVGIYLGEDLIQTRTIDLLPSANSKVNINDSLKITLRRKSASVTVDGRAKSAGTIGESIQVETVTGALLNGTLVAPGLVEVKQ